MKELNENGPKSVLDLKRELLNGKTGPEEFLNSLMNLDQSTPQRQHSRQNVEVLTDLEVQNFFNQHQQYQFQYGNLLSLSYFHRGQLEATGGLYAEGLNSFKRARDAAAQINEENYQGWRDYVDGTISYFELDLKSLEKILQRIDEGRNKEILTKFSNRLKTGKESDYLADCS